MSDKKTFKLGSGDTNGKLEELKKSLPAQKNIPAQTLEQEEKKIERMYDEISEIIGNVFGDEFSKRAGKAFKKDAEKKNDDLIKNIENFVCRKAKTERWFDLNLSVNGLDEKVKNCIRGDIESIRGIKNAKTFRKNVLEVVGKKEEEKDENRDTEGKKKKEESIPLEIKSEFHLYEKWIPVDQDKASFRVVDYNNGEFTLVFDVNRRQRNERIKKVSIEELRKRIKNGKYSVEDLSKVDLKTTAKGRDAIEKEKWDDVSADYLHLTEKTFGEDGKQLTNIDFAKAVLFSQVGKWEELNAKTPEEREAIINGKILQFFVEMGLAVHGMVKKDEDTKMMDINKKPDMDGKIVLFLLNKIGVEAKGNPETGNVEYVMPGNHALGKITFDSGKVDGVEIRKEQNEKGEWVISVIVDHHGDTSPRDTSAAEVAYQTFEKLGMLEEYFQKDSKNKEGLEKLIQLNNRIDNFDFPNGKEYFDNYFQNSWDTMIGISRMINPQNLLDFLGDGRNIDDAVRSISEMNLSEKEMKRYGILQQRDIKDQKRIEEIANEYGIDLEKDGTVGKITKEKIEELSKKGIFYSKERKTFREYVDVREMQKERVIASQAVLQEMEKDGLIIESDRFGRIAVDIDGRIKTGPEAARAFGCGTRVLWDPEYNRFGVDTLGGEELVDSEGNLLANKYHQGVEVRKTMWLKSLAEKDEPLNIKLETILQELTDGKFVPTGKLKEYIDNGGKWEENKNDTQNQEEASKGIPKLDYGELENEWNDRKKRREDEIAAKKVGIELNADMKKEVDQQDTAWNNFINGIEEEKEGDIENITKEPENKSPQKTEFEAGNMSVDDFNKLEREVGFSRKLYVGYWCTFEKKKKHLEEYFGKTGDPNFLGQAQEDMKKLESDYNEKREEYEKEFLANMRKFYQENDKLEGNSLEEAMIQEGYYLKLEESFRKERIKLEVWSYEGKLMKGFRGVFNDKLKGFWNGIWKNTKEKTNAGIDLGRQGAENVKQGIETEIYNIGQDIEIVKDAVETGLSSDKRKKREEILDRRQIGRKRSSVSSQEEAKKETVSDKVIDIPISKEEDGNEIEKNADVIEGLAESSAEVKSVEFDLQEFHQKVMKKVSGGKNSLWKEMKGKSIEGILRSKNNSQKGKETKIFHGNISRVNELAEDNLEGRIQITPEMTASQWLLKVYEMAKKEEKVDEVFSF